MTHKGLKTMFRCFICHKYLCLLVGSTCWSDYHTKVKIWRLAEPKVINSDGLRTATNFTTPRVVGVKGCTHPGNFSTLTAGKSNCKTLSAGIGHACIQPLARETESIGAARCHCPGAVCVVLLPPCPHPILYV